MNIEKLLGLGDINSQMRVKANLIIDNEYSYTYQNLILVMQLKQE